MAIGEQKKIVYLFGAGATHAELTNLEPDLIREKHGLLIGDVSSRVIQRVRRQKKYLANVKMVSGTAGSLNIELLISLLESSKVHDWAYKTNLLKQLVAKDIKAILVRPRTRRFHLHDALFELHSRRKALSQERIIGLISLNYDTVLDEAYRRYHGEPNYSFSLDDTLLGADKIPLLKLHGSFNWSNRIIRGRRRTIEIIPLGATKTYLHTPYGFIWSRALKALTECDTLRVVGCSLSLNDAHLIDLLFKAHLERSSAFEIEIIAPVEAGDTIRANYGFFPRIRSLLEIEEQLIPERSPANPFKTWLKYKSIRMLGHTRIKRTRHLKIVAR